MNSPADKPKPRKRRKREPIQVNMTLVVKTGPEPEDKFTIMDNRRVPMVGSVFEYRLRIRRFFVSTLLRVATSSPAVYREIAPGLMTLIGRKRETDKASAKKKS